MIFLEGFLVIEIFEFVCIKIGKVLDVDIKWNIF